MVKRIKKEDKMAIIYTYPVKVTPAANDLILISDSADSQKTKQVKVSTLPSPITLTTVGTSGAATLNGTILNIPNYAAGGTPSLPLNGVQYRDDNGNFAAASSLIFESNNGKLIVGDQANDIYGIIEIQSDNDVGAELKIQGGGGYYTTIRGSQLDTASYNITLPVSGPGGNDKILQSNSNGDLSWIDTPSSSATPASITGTTSTNPSTFANTPYTFESTSTGSGSGAPFATQVNSSAGAKHIAFYYQTTLCGSISQNGTNAVSYNTSSDYRLKENVVDITGSVDRLKQLKPSRFNFITDGSSRTVDGFLAHEVSSIVPEAITGIKDAVDAENNIIPQGIDQSKLVPLMVGAIKELTARIEALEA